MLIKVIAIIETVVHVESPKFNDKATAKAEEIVASNCYKALREDIEKTKQLGVTNINILRLGR